MIERDDGYVDFDDIGRYFAPRRSWMALDRAAFGFLRGRVLDVGCGAGRVALELQARGHDAVGLDVSPGAVRVCRERGARDVRLAALTRVDASFGTFDALAMFGNNFGLFENPRRAVWLLRRLRSRLAPGGRVVATTLDPFSTEDRLHRAYHARNRARGRAPGQIRLRVRYTHAATPWFDYLFCSRREVQAIAREADWRIAELIDDEGPSFAVILEPPTM